MHIFDPTGELHLQRVRAERRFQALYFAYLLAILALVLVMGGNQ